MAEFLADFDTAHCGVIHDSQLDTYGQWLATASADGNVRLWDVRQPRSPALLADLGGHAGPVQQVAWAPPEVGVLLASGGADGCVLVWGRRAEGGRWHVVHRQALEQHGAVRSVAWAPPEHGAVLACACSDGTVSVVKHVGALSTSPTEVEHKWQDQPFDAHRGEAVAVSWASAPPGLDLGASLGVARARLEGARLATAGSDGVRLWQWNNITGFWDEEAADQQLKELKGAARDVAWKPWDGVAEMLAAAVGERVLIWRRGQDEAAAVGCGGRGPWRVSMGEDVWKLSWADAGSVLLVSYGLEEPRAALLKQRLDGEWDIMDVAEAPAGSASRPGGDGLGGDLACRVGGA